VNWILDADIEGFFDDIDREWLVKFVEHRIGDQRIVRLVQKWLNAGIIEDTDWSDTGKGTPQGAILSPLLANVYLHYVFDLWLQQWRKRHAKGECYVVPYADDIVICFEHESDARTCLAALKDRMEKFGLRLHPAKTRLIEFGRGSAAKPTRPVPLDLVSDGSSEQEAFAAGPHPASLPRNPFSRPTRRRSRMREYFTYGSVRGAAGNGGPYRDSHATIRLLLGASWRSVLRVCGSEFWSRLP